MKYWYEISNVHNIDTPALVVYPERVEQNIDVARSMIQDVTRLRPHVKTHKNKEVTRLLMERGVSKFKCATISEAQMLAECGCEDVLLAYQPVGPKILRLIKLINDFPSTRFSCLVDNERVVKDLSSAVRQNAPLAVFIDVNVGMNRTGILPNKALSLYKACGTAPGMVPIGLHAYDGHVRNPDIEERSRECDACFRQIEILRDEIVRHGFPDPAIVIGGSPTFPIHARREKVECSPGTFVYWDEGYGKICAEQSFQAAALVLTRVVSIPAEQKICVDLGHKSIAAENDISRRVRFLNAPDLKPVSQSEEHLVLETTEKFSVGDLLYGVPYHICPTCALYEKAITVENGKAVGEWRTIARDRG